MRHDKGYALFIVLALLSLLFILTTSLCENVKTGVREARLRMAEAKALGAADSGLQYGLEMIRQNVPLTNSIKGASWNSLKTEDGVTTCFKVFAAELLDTTDLQIQSLGEVVHGPCGDYSEEPDHILAARVLLGTIDLTPGKETLVRWEEVLQ